MPEYEFFCTPIIPSANKDGTYNYITSGVALCRAIYEEYTHPVLGCMVYKMVGLPEVIRFVKPAEVAEMPQPSARAMAA